MFLAKALYRERSWVMGGLPLADELLEVYEERMKIELTDLLEDAESLLNP